MSAPEDTPHTAALGHVIGARRRKRGISSRALAAAAGIGRRQLALIERGEGHAQTFDALIALAATLQVRPRVLLGEAERRAEALQTAERAVVLALLDRDPPATRTRERLHATLADIDPGVLATALAQLNAAGVIRCEAKHARVSAAARRLQVLGLLSI